MTDDELFSAVLRELAELLGRLGPLGARTVLIGGQVLAIEGLRRTGSGIIRAETETGITVERGFSLEPDLLVDLDADRFAADQLPEILRHCGYKRVRDFRWAKPLPDGAGEQQVILDLFRSPDIDVENVATSMTELPDAELVLRRSVPVEVELGSARLQIRIPDALSFLKMKVRAKREQRPKETKDSFDVYAYVQLQGAASVSAELSKAGADGSALLQELKALFWDVTSPGVRDVIASATTLAPHERALLAQGVVDLFADL